MSLHLMIIKVSIFGLLVSILTIPATAQKPKTSELLDAGLRLAELFSKKPKAAMDTCSTIFIAANLTSSNISVLVRSTSDSSGEDARLTVSPGSKGQLLSLKPGIYRCQALAADKTILLSTEINLISCQTQTLEVY